MKRLSLIVPLITVLTLAACSGHADSFVLRGTLVGGGNDSILITGIDRRFDRVDTIRMENGSFKYECSPDTVVPLIMFLPGGRNDVVFADKGLEATYHRDTADAAATIEGGLYNGQYADFLSAITDSMQIDEIAYSIDSFIVTNPDSEVAPYLIWRYLLNDSRLSSQRILSLTDRLSGQMQDNVLISEIRAAFKNSVRAANRMSDIALTDTAFTSVRLREICGGKRMLIYVWASWDSVSRCPQAEMSRIEKEYKSKNITIAGLSVDANRNRWKATVLNDSLEWRQFADLNGWSGRVVSDLKIDAIPYFVLLDPELSILSTSRSLETVEMKIASLEDWKESKTSKKTAPDTPKKSTKPKLHLKK